MRKRGIYVLYFYTEKLNKIVILDGNCRAGRALIRMSRAFLCGESESRRLQGPLQFATAIR